MRNKWKKTGTLQHTVNPQVRNGTTYTAVINQAANVYTLTINPGAVVSAHPNLKEAKNKFRKFLLDK